MIVFFVYNILIFNYKDTKNYRDYQLFKRISYPELIPSEIDLMTEEEWDNYNPSQENADAIIDIGM